MSKLPALCAELQLLAEQRWKELQQQREFEPAWQNHEQEIKQAFTLSDFIYQQCLKAPTLLNSVLEDEHLDDFAAHYKTQLSELILKVNNEAELSRCLRQFRHQQMVIIAWRDLLNKQPVAQSLLQVSELANQLITQANTWLYSKLSERYGVPQGEHGPQPLLIIGMGKLGGNELNFSSDIDLIFTYPAQGETQGGRQSIEHQQFFTKLAQALISALHQVTVDGQVFRVDMRLRPLGDSGPLVMHFDAFEDYYQEQGRDWERYALLKGRILNQSDNYTIELQTILQPFIYRRYLDFSAIESLRNMKALIQQEVRRRGLVNNIKLGQGGIREAEFIVQSLQLIRGGREPSLQVHSLLEALNQLTHLEVMSDSDASQLIKAYLWLRKVEHCLQQFNDKQTQELPDNHQDQARLQHVMGYSNYALFQNALALHCEFIHQQFLMLVGENNDEQQPTVSNELQSAIDLWQLDLSIQESHELLKTSLSEEQATSFAQLLQDFKTNIHSSRIGQFHQR